MSEEGALQPGPASGERVAIGITFSNSNSSIAYTLDGKVEVIANEDGDRQIATILSYVDGEEYYGQQAKAFLVRNPKNTIAYFRDFLGQDFKSIDPTHTHASAHPSDEAGGVAFKVQDKEGEDSTSTLSVTEVTTRSLRRLIASASGYLGKKVTSAVIAVPTNFSEKQKEALTAAAAAADLEVLQLISEPTAALLAHDARPESVLSDKTVVVADLGGTRSDVTVFASRGGMYTILATAHDTDFAGAALDKVLIDHFAKEFTKKHSGVDPRENARSLAKLKLEAEATKKALSLGNNASYSIESLAEGFDFSGTINRVRYETIARSVFEGFNRLVESAVKKAGLDVLDIDEVILSGGTAHTPRIAANLRNIFPESTSIVAPSTLTTAVNPSELQVRGAALQASLIQEYDAEDIDQSTHEAIRTVQHVKNAIGVVVRESADPGADIFQPVIEPETAVPARRTVHILAPKAGGDVLVKVVEGNTHIKVTKPEPKAKTNGTKENGAAEEDEDSDFDDDEDEEEEDKREREWKVGKTLAEAAVRGVKKGGKIEVTVNVAADLAVTITTREVGGKGGVRGTL